MLKPIAILLCLVAWGCSRSERMDMLYLQRCVSCHGPTGRGDGQVAASLPLAVPDFRETVERRSNGQMRRIITQGKGVMPAFAPALNPGEINDMVSMSSDFIQNLDLENAVFDYQVVGQKDKVSDLLIGVLRRAELEALLDLLKELDLDPRTVAHPAIAYRRAPRLARFASRGFKQRVARRHDAGGKQQLDGRIG